MKSKLTTKDLPRRRKGKSASKITKSKPRVKQLMNKTPKPIPSVASQHGMALRARSKAALVNNRDSVICDNGGSTRLSPAGASALPTFSTIEPIVRASSKMPPGYAFVPKGDPYMTRNCRQQTRKAHQVVYAVINDEKKQVGIRVPLSIFTTVKESAIATSDQRRLIVKKRDEDLEKRFREAILARFPRIPPEEIRMIIRRATEKGTGRVGRTGRMEMLEKAYLATQAHIRHSKTDYDKLLKSGTNREAARALTTGKVSDMLNEWGPAHTKQPVQTATERTFTVPTQKANDCALPQAPTAKATKQSKLAGHLSMALAAAGALGRATKTKSASSGNTAARSSMAASLPTLASTYSAVRRRRPEKRKPQEAAAGQKVSNPQ